MGSFDCFCAVCGGPLSHSLQFGLKSAKALARRKRRLEKEKRRRAGETDVPDSEDETRSSDDATSNVEMADGRDAGEGQEEDEEFYGGYEQDHCYNPEIVSESSTEWVGKCRCLGFNADAPGISKAFISGPGCYTDYGEFDVREPGDDPNDPGEGSYPCFHAYDSNEILVFPFHEACFKVLCRSLVGHENVTKIDKDILYSSLSQLNDEDYSRHLEVDYGGIQGMEQFWDCISGEEYTVSDPTVDPEIADAIHIEMSGRTFDNLPTKLDLGSKVRADPFAKFPHDILNMIFPYLPHEGILAFRQASWYVFKSTSENSFWKRMIRREVLPWFWELEPFVQPSLILENIDAKGLYFWLHKVTTPTFGMEGPFMGIANRRRIWNVCEEIKKLYMKSLGQGAEFGDQDDEVAGTIMEKSISLQMPIVLHPQPKGGITISQQWIRSWDDLHHPSKVFESFWSSEGRLVGLGVKFGSDRRIFGQREGEDSGITNRSIPIPASEWIKDIVLHLSPINLLERPARNLAVEALELILTSGKRLDIVPGNPGLNQRVLAVPPGMHLTGLVGQVGNANNVAAFGIISNMPIVSRLGILQCAKPGEEPAEVPKLPQVQRLLWKEPAASIPTEGAKYSTTAPIWSHPRFRMIPFEIPGRHEEVSLDVLPHEILLWAKENSELKRLTRISALVIESGTATTFDETGEITWPIHDVLGMRAEYEQRYWEPKRTVGSGRVPVQEDPKAGATESTELKENQTKQSDWPEEHLVHFDIDGPGGEIITEIHVAEEAKAIKLHTNRGRESYFGEARRNSWHVVRPVEGEVLVGMAVCFGTPSGWTWDIQKHTHLKTTTATGLVMSTAES